MAQLQTRGGRRRGGYVAEMNVVPYIDVMLVLLVIFMVTAPMITQGFQVELPEVKSDAIAVADAKQTVHVYVFKNGSTGLVIGDGDKEKGLTQAQLIEKIQAHMAQFPESPVMLEGDGGASYGQVASVMGALQGSGVTRMALVTDVPTE